MKSLKVFNDDGHGWLQVKKADLEDLGIIDKISPLSRTDGDWVYLEEDMDAKTYLDALGTDDVSFDEHYEKRSIVRDMGYFRESN